MKAQRRNIELKARCSDLATVHAKAQNLGARDMGILCQRDTFFAAPHARLKLREFGDGRAELISYVRPDVATARGSDYVLAPIAHLADLRAALEHALGIVGTVSKRRHLFLIQATRIHLDEVEGLGSFVELETVIDRQSEDEAFSELRTIAEALGIQATDLVALPYTEQLEHLRSVPQPGVKPGQRQSE
jgi:predicted adenylyl cyclase CyaB